MGEHETEPLCCHYCGMEHEPPSECVSVTPPGTDNMTGIEPRWWRG